VEKILTLSWVGSWNRPMPVGMLTLFVAAGASAAPDAPVPPLLYIAAPPSGVLGARLLVFEAQTD
jgi:hypothetical protein